MKKSILAAGVALAALIPCAVAPSAAFAATAAPAPANPTLVELARLKAKGYDLYRRGDLAGARKVFEDMELIQPGNADARVFLDQTREEWARYEASQKEASDERQRLRAADKQLETPITVETTRATPINEFVNTLSFASGIDFHVGSGVSANINAKFVDTPLSEVLDTTLVPMGLEWRMSNGVVEILPALMTRSFRLEKFQMAKVKALYDAGVLQQTLWGPEGKAQLAGESLTLDERDYMLIATDSKSRLDKIAALLVDLDRTIEPDLLTRFYKIDPGQGQRIKGLIDAVIRTDGRTAFDMERRVYVSGQDLILRETPERIANIEDLLRNRKFIDRLVSDRIQVQSFPLIPRNELRENHELMTHFAEQVVEQVSTFLYSAGGKAQASADGRKMWFDPTSLTMVLTDTPDNLRQIEEFLASLPELESRDRFKVLFLRYAVAEDMLPQLRQFLGLDPASATGGGDEDALSTNVTLRREDEFEWRDLMIVVRRISNLNTGDDLNDSAELLLRVAAGGQSQQTTVTELGSEVTIQDNAGGNYRIYSPEVRPSNTNGEGRVELEITYEPTGSNIGGGGGGNPVN